MSISRNGARLGLTCVCATLWGCAPSGSRSAVEAPHVDPQGAASKAMEMYDKDGNGLIAGDELAACPGILRFQSAYDPNNDGVSLDEVRTRLEQLFGANAAGLMTVSCKLRSRGAPIANAQIRLVPEPFLADAIKTAIGTTDGAGEAILAIPDDQLPASDRGLNAMQVGIYRIEIDSPANKANKTFGWEVSGLTREGNSVELDLGR